MIGPRRIGWNRPGTADGASTAVARSGTSTPSRLKASSAADRQQHRGFERGHERARVTGHWTHLPTRANVLNQTTGGADGTAAGPLRLAFRYLSDCTVVARGVWYSIWHR